MRPGESISFAEMLRYNQIDTRRVDMLPKLNGNDIMPANIMPGESRQSLCYRQIGKLDISDLEKARLDVVAQNIGKQYVGENEICKISCSASLSDFELLASVGLAEKGVRFVCKECGEPCAVISAKDLEIYKRTWQLLELKSPTDAEISEFVNLCERGYRYIQISCNNKDCNAQQDVIITDMAELREHRNESEIIYKIHDAIVWKALFLRFWTI